MKKMVQSFFAKNIKRIAREQKEKNNEGNRDHKKKIRAD